MVLRVLLEIGPVVVDRHLIQRQPTVFGLAQMTNEHNTPLLQVGKDRIKLGIVDHDQFAMGVTEYHADILPDFDSDRALGDCLVEVPNRLLLPIGFVPARHGKR